MPGATEKISHGEPTFFIKNGVFAMFSNNHHHDGHVALWLPAVPGLQEALIEKRRTRITGRRMSVVGVDCIPLDPSCNSAIL